jgi:SPP1 family predicted phage head-tail adaptor
MNAGDLRHRVSIQRPSAALDDLGQPLGEWEEVASLWAGITDRRGGEVVEAREATLNEVTTDVRLRFTEAFQPEMRVVEQCHSHRVFQIVDIRQNYAPRPETLLECQERLVEAVEVLS